MTDNKRVTNKQLMEELLKFRKALSKTAVDLKLHNEDLNSLATKIVSRMVKLKSMEDWFEHVNKSSLSWNTSYEELDLPEDIEALGEAAKLMTIMNICQEDEEYEKCAIIKNRMNEVNKILKRYNK